MDFLLNIDTQIFSFVVVLIGIAFCISIPFFMLITSDNFIRKNLRSLTRIYIVLTFIGINFIVSGIWLAIYSQECKVEPIEPVEYVSIDQGYFFNHVYMCKIKPTLGEPKSDWQVRSLLYIKDE